MYNAFSMSDSHHLGANYMASTALPGFRIIMED